MKNPMPTPGRTASGDNTTRRPIRTALIAVLAILLLATVAAPASAQGNGNGPPDIPPGQAKKTAEEAVAQDAPEEALRIVGRRTYVLEESGATTPTNRGNGKGQPQYGSGAGLKLGLNGTKGSPGPSSQRGVSKVDSDQPGSEYFVQTLGADLGLRVMVALDGPEAPSDYTFDIELPDGAVVAEASDGSVGIGLGHQILATIAAPWAIDADGNDVPVSQHVTSTEITLSVDTTGVTAWPVIADPTYSNLTSCPYNPYGSAKDFTMGWACPSFWHFLSACFWCA